MIAGKYVGLASDEGVIDYQLAKDLGVSVGDRIRVNSSMGNSESMTVAGIYSRGQGRGGAYVTLRTGQSLFSMGNSVNVILVKVNQLFDSDAIADQIEKLVPYEARSWSREYPSFVSSLTVQSASAYLISAFSLIASSFAIASVLIVSVLAKVETDRDIEKHWRYPVSDPARVYIAGTWYRHCGQRLWCCDGHAHCLSD